MTGREFVRLIKRGGSDGVGSSVLTMALDDPKLPGESVNQRVRDWVRSLNSEERELLKDLLQDAAEFATAGVLCVIDGVAGEFPGVFEVVAVEGEENRQVVNPENTDMLHDLYSDLCYGEDAK